VIVSWAVAKQRFCAAKGGVCVLKAMPLCCQQSNLSEMPVRKRRAASRMPNARKCPNGSLSESSPCLLANQVSAKVR
jgi:hypothetical protein